MLIDAHLHIEDASLVECMRKEGIAGISNAASVAEYERLKTYQRTYPQLRISVGIHPWYATKTSWDHMLPLLEKTDIIGEIGLDKVWCDTPYSEQYDMFERQLAYASHHRKPVILHLKGYEKEALALIKHYENRYLVHWYSTKDVLTDYIDAGCWFTIGPSLPHDESVQYAAQRVPLSRMLIETDGLSALQWCEPTCITLADYSRILQRSMAWIAQSKGITTAALEEQMEQNYQAFCCQSTDSIL